MKSWFKCGSRSKLLIFFTGWGFCPTDLDFLNEEDNSLLGFYDYSDLSIPASAAEVLLRFNGDRPATVATNRPATLAANRPAKYVGAEISLVAWSLGVWAASRVYPFLPPLKAALAINGTPIGIDDSWGIPQRAFDLTVRSLRPGHFDRFYKRIIDRPEELQRFLQSQTQTQDYGVAYSSTKRIKSSEAVSLQQDCSVARTDFDRIEELRAICRQWNEEAASQNKVFGDVSQYKPPQTPGFGFFTQAIVGRSDQIFPPKNQLAYWNGQNESGVTGSDIQFRLVQIDAPHFPFYRFQSWRQLWDIR